MKIVSTIYRMALAFALCLCIVSITACGEPAQNSHQAKKILVITSSNTPVSPPTITPSTLENCPAQAHGAHMPPLEGAKHPAVIYATGAYQYLISSYDTVIKKTWDIFLGRQEPTSSAPTSYQSAQQADLLTYHSSVSRTGEKGYELFCPLAAKDVRRFLLFSAFYHSLFLAPRQKRL